jgi:type IV pilus biogenesis protein CpaD/CtpE
MHADPARTIQAKFRSMIMAAAAGLLAGCACEDDVWTTAVATEPEAVKVAALETCDASPLPRLSKSAAELSARADPAMLEIARLEAERDCYKAAAFAAYQRSEVIK